MNKIHTLTDTGFLLISCPDNGGIRLYLLSGNLYSSNRIPDFNQKLQGEFYKSLPLPHTIRQFSVLQSFVYYSLSKPFLYFICVYYLTIFDTFCQSKIFGKNISIQIIINHRRNFLDPICSIIFRRCRKDYDHIIGFLSVNNRSVVLITVCFPSLVRTFYTIRKTGRYFPSAFLLKEKIPHLSGISSGYSLSPVNPFHQKTDIPCR